MLKRTSANLLIDLLAAALFLGMAATGYLLYFPLPHGANRTLHLWGLARHQWGQVHFWLSVGFLSILLVHVALHWHWLVAMVCQRLGIQHRPAGLAAGCGLVAVLVFGLLVASFAWLSDHSVHDHADPSPLVAPTASTTPPATTVRSDAVDFWTEVYPVLEEACLRCHGPSRGRGNFRIDRREDYFGLQDRPAMVIPGNSAASPLVAIVSGQRPEMAMAASHILPERHVAKLRAWIDGGASWPPRPSPPAKP